MDTVTDLAARAVSFISLIQDIFLQGTMAREEDHKIILSQIFCSDFESNFRRFIKPEDPDKKKLTNFEARSIELVWISAKEPDKNAAVDYTIKLSVALVAWICKHKEEILDKLNTCGTFPTPYGWREIISNVLYPDVSERVELAKALQYLPVQVVLASACKAYNARKQRLAQLWNVDEADLRFLLTVAERKIYTKIAYTLNEQPEELLKDDKKLSAKLREAVPLQFELVFKDEIEEIGKSRAKRYREQCLINAIPDTVASGTGAENESDTFATAKEMKLYALAFSGGGIRSATFNLGILQGLAKNGLISKFDYMSTVSGGGYIGSWLAAWIKRDGSVAKVADRLNPDKSPDPFGEEVRPIRWLRMFSNYFAPVASVMSVDAWTIGITWLRNTLLNQVIILMLFLSALLSIKALYRIWRMPIWATDGVLYAVCGTLLLLSLVAGLGMQAYHKDPGSSD